MSADMKKCVYLGNEVSNRWCAKKAIYECVCPCEFYDTEGERCAS